MSALFSRSRDCICCRASAKERDASPDRPNIIGISLTMYYRGKGKGTLKGDGKVQICSDCLARVLASKGIFEGKEARQFLAAIRERLSRRYSDLLREDAEILPEYASRDSRELSRELFGGGQ